MAVPTPVMTSDHSWLSGQWLPWVGVAVAASVLGIAGLFFAGGEVQVALISVAITLILASLWHLILFVIRKLMQKHMCGQLQRMFAQDGCACYGAAADGRILFSNPAGENRLHGDRRITSLLEGVFAHPGAVIYRLQHAAQLGRQAREDLSTNQGQFRLSVFRAAHDLYLWRLEEVVDHTRPKRGPEAISLPMLIATEGGVILFSNEALRKLLGVRPKKLDRVILDHPLRSGAEVTLAGVTGLIRATAVVIAGGADRREIYLLPTGVTSAQAEGEDLENFPIAVLRLSEEGVVRYANREARAIFSGGIEGHCHLSDLVEGLGRSVRDWVEDVAAGRLPGRPEVLKLRKSDIPEAFVQIAIRRLGPSGQSGLIATISDATAMKTLEAQFVQSQKMQAIGQLAGGVAHDFNNLLTAISGHCDLLLLNQEPSDPGYEDLAQIRQNANRAAALVRQLLAVSRKQTLMPEVVHPSEVLSDVTHLLRRLVGEQIRLCFVSHDEGEAIRTDRRQLEQVLMNLVVNARDAMPRGGEITITTNVVEFDESKHIDGATVPAGTYSQITVRDEGTGIAPEHMSKLFEPFFTTKRMSEGTGLGLSTVYGIIKQSGGFIFVESELGQSTEFRIYFPIHKGETHSPDVAAVLGPLKSGSGTVLLVEDEAPVRAFAARALRLRGYTVLEAEHAEAALDLLTDEAVLVDVIVTDVVMPGLDGPDWVEHALRTRPAVKVVFMSGYAEESFADRQAGIPNSVFLPKPFSLDELTRTVQMQLAS